jgi:hypothetical protein
MRNLPLVVVIVLFVCLARSQQTATQDGSTSATVPAGSTIYRLVVTVAEPPAPKDFIETTVSTSAVTTTLILPNGRKITAENAESEGFSWSQGFDGPAPLGSEDYGQSVAITFRKRAPSGRYTFEFAFKQLRQSAKVKAHFTSRMSDYLAVLRAAPGAQLSKPAPFSPSARVTIDLPKEEEDLIFDVVVPDANTEVVLVLPDGRKLRRSDAKKPDVNWKIETHPEEGLLNEIYPPLEGTQQIIGFKRAAKGRYEIHAAPKTATKGEMTVAVLPMNALAQAIGVKLTSMNSNVGEISSSGGIKIRAKQMPYECYVGDKVDFQFELVGSVGPQPHFEIREERRAWLRSVQGGEQYADPDPVEVLPVQVTPVGPQTYRGGVIPAKPGWVRISIRATGKSASGEPFTTETLLTSSTLKVNPIAARFLGFTAKPIAPEGGSRFDRLEVSADLDVLMPGDYAIVVDLTNTRAAGFEQPVGRGHATLQPGRQTLTASIPSSEIWRNEGDGPLDVAIWFIYRTQDSTYSMINVLIDTPKLQTPAYRRDQWDPGQVYGEDHVTVRGIDPAASGKFRYAEVEWEVSTPGLECNWNGSLRGVRAPYTGGNLQADMDAKGEARLPAGKTKVSFFFDGASINRFGKQDWKLWAGLTCGPALKGNDSSRPYRWSLTPSPKIDLNPDEYEPSHGSFSVQPAPIALRLSPGGSDNNSRAWVKDKKDVQFAVTDVPKGVEAELTGPYESPGYISGSLRITTSPDAVPGRYFFTVSATAGTEVETTKVVLDIVP